MSAAPEALLRMPEKHFQAEIRQGGNAYMLQLFWSDWKEIPLLAKSFLGYLSNCSHCTPSLVLV